MQTNGSAAKAARGKLSPDDVKLRTALEEARERLHWRVEEPSGTDIVFEVMRDLLTLDRRQPRYTPAEYVSPHPQVLRSLEEREEAAKKRTEELRSGDAPERVFNLAPTREDSANAETILRCFQSLVVTASDLNSEERHMQARNWRIVRALAMGGSLRKTAPQFGLKFARIRQIKMKALWTIWNAVKHLLSAEVLSRAAPVKTGMVWMAAA